MARGDGRYAFRCETGYALCVPTPWLILAHSGDDLPIKLAQIQRPLGTATIRWLGAMSAA
jgi:hypothetical protein